MCFFVKDIWTIWASVEVNIEATHEGKDDRYRQLVSDK